MSIRQEPPPPVVSRIATLVAVSRPNGGWLHLVSPPQQVLLPTSFGESGETQRQQIVTSAWIPGSTIVSSVPDMITEQFTIELRFGDLDVVDAFLADAKAALRQPQFRLRRQIGGGVYEFSCQGANMSTQTLHPHWHLGWRRLAVQVRRQPWETRVEWSVP